MEMNIYPCIYQVLQGLANVQNRFDSGADNCDWRASKFNQICTDIKSQLGSPVNTADTTCCHYLNTSCVCN